jgi:putative ABC transport system ATP-binding protein
MIRLSHVTRRYSPTVAALDDVSLEIAEHEFVSITGPSGCGKSTLLHVLGGLDQPDAGEVHVGDIALHSASEQQLTEYRRRTVGIVFQFFHLLPTMSVLENVCLPLLLQGERLASVRTRAEEMIELVGLTDRTSHLPHQLSGGQMQRTAIARALIHQPRVLLADEPTGNLDSASAGQVLALLQKIAGEKRTTLLVVTHSEEVASLTSRRIRLHDGRTV